MYKNEFKIYVRSSCPPTNSRLINCWRDYKEQQKINENDIIYISNTGSKRINDINSFTLQKFLNPLKNYFKLLFHLKKGNVQNVYLAPSINGISFLRDFIYVAIGKIFKAKIILHLHNKGVINNSKHLHYHILYKVFLKTLIA